MTPDRGRFRDSVAREGGSHSLGMKKKLEEALEEVVDPETFIVFVSVLAEERQAASLRESEMPGRYRLDGPHGWKNNELSSFLLACWTTSKPSPFMFQNKMRRGECSRRSSTTAR